MSLARILSRTQLGLDVPLAQVELHDGRGLPGFTIVGLPAPVVRESRERVRAALLNSGYEFPAGRITVNLAPVELSKQGARFDLPIASGQLSAPQRAFEGYGELGLAGELRPVSGLFLAALHAGEDGHALIVPAGNGAEVALSGVGGQDVPLRRPGGKRVRRHDLDTRLDQVVPALDVLRVAVPYREDDNSVRRDPVVGLVVPVLVDKTRVDEQVHVVNVTNGERLVTYAIEGGHGEICMNGAAAHKARPGDIVIIITYVNVDADRASSLRPTVVKVDARNRPLVPAAT